MRYRGFSLLETLMYIGLFAIIMDGMFAGLYAVSESADRNQTKAYLAEEGEFIIDKISYEISEASAASLPSLGASNTELDLVSSINGDSSISLYDGEFVVSRGSAETVPFSSGRVQVSNVVFTNNSSGVESPSPISFSFTLQARTLGGRALSEDFSSNAYLGL